MAKSADDAKDTTDIQDGPASEPTTESTSTKGGTARDKGADKRSGDPRKRAAAQAKEDKAEAKARHKVKAQRIGNPSWFVPLMLALMLIGLVWVVTFYITQEKYPVESWGRWNLGGGFAFILAGFAMTTRWK
ncbi:cell division protein CrgA [Janibacter limosus]|uniref:cell division protein CrgA n=1 Tax=Janibacter limosus TaxID=53458 RepID=UPI001F5EDA57|nr:cell division protein CrgA [Janibacter limosus]